MVVLHELRARVRGVLGLWVEAGEDIRVALKGLEQTEDVANIDSDEERMEVSTGTRNQHVGAYGRQKKRTRRNCLLWWPEQRHFFRVHFFEPTY